MREVRLALREDGRDVTGRAFVPARARARGLVVARESAVLCGLAAARAAFRAVDPSLRVFFLSRDGRRVRPGRPVLRVVGRARSILAAERVALNFLQRLSGVATLTAEFVRRSRATIVDTRKTTPGLRALEKYAVRCGGGRNHRFGLSDAVLIKENHLPYVIGNPSSVIAELRRRGLFVQVEAQSMEQLRRVLAWPVDAVLLDNFRPAALRRAVRLARRLRPRLLIEASGGVTLATVRAISSAGVDRVSVGAITHSARAIDFSLDLTPLP
jgi:nicotinate-nucleotide pyrophosphorylase (carboxylating)